MKYGYKVTGNGLYLPLYDNGNGKGWEHFQRKHVNGMMFIICKALGDLSAPRRWSDGQWLLEPTDKKIPFNERVVFFTSPIYLHAFLGAAMYWYEKPSSIEVSKTIEVVK